MGKVYDALQRAEAERSRRRSVDAPTPQVAWEPARPRKAQPRGGRGRLRRWVDSFRSPAGAEDANAINKRRFSLLEPESFVAEQFRTLRARIDSIAAQQPLRTVAVTSALAGEGKSTAAINLALVTAMGVGRRILLVDCDLRKPRIHSALGLRPEAGLAEVLTDQVSLDNALVKVEGVNLEVLPVRQQPPNPSELLASDRMRTLIEELARNYDRVFIDLPATLGLPDAKTVSELSDGLLLVVRAGVTPEPDVQAALDILDRRRILGLVLNGAETDQERLGYTY